MERQRQQIKTLEARVADLTRQLESLGMAPGTGSTATTRSAVADGKLKRVVFIVDSHMLSGAGRGAVDEVVRAIGELDNTQWFNVIVQPGADPIPLSKTFLAPNAENRKRAEELLRKGYMASEVRGGLGAFTLAAQWRCDLVWYVGRGGPYPDRFANEAGPIAAHAKVPVNTTVHFAAPHESTVRHALWKLANDTGGRCIDSDGKEVAEPPQAVVLPVPKPAPTTRPSVLNPTGAVRK